MKFLPLLLIAILAPPALAAPAQPAPDDGLLARGRYLTQLGDCRACHTQPGRPPFAGGTEIDTPFGVVYAPNITPDPKTGIGTWSFSDFYKAMHEGIGPDGEYFYPAFPFPSYTRLSKADVKAIWAYLRSIDPVRQPNPSNGLRWPYSVRSALRIWRAFNFEPGTFKPEPDRSANWNRGAYLVTGLAHCGACHTPRNRWGAKIDEQALTGGSVPIDNWIAPNITPNPHAGIGAWSTDALKNFLTTGRSDRGDALGPMRDVVQTSLQHLNASDLNAVVAYLQHPSTGESAPRAATTTTPTPVPAPAVAQATPGAGAAKPLPGQALYHKHCAGCHGDDGHARHDYYPDLRDNAVVLDRNPTNLVLMMLRGGFQASTQAWPYPYSMPPFGFRLSDREIAEIANYVRRNWSKRPVPQILPEQVEPLR